IILHLVREQALTVLLSTAYLDEAERCDRAVVLHGGRVLAQGPPGEVSGLAAGRTFLAAPPVGQKARELQARLLDDPHVVDAVPEAGRVRVTLGGEPGAVPGLPRPSPVPPRFEDGFMVLL